MSTLHKVKAYFGMAPLDDYEDEYYEDDERGPSRGGYARRPRAERFEDDEYGPVDGRDYDGPDYEAPGYRGGYHDDPRFEPRMRAPREFDRPHDMGRPRFAPLRGATRGALAMDPRRMAELFDAGSPLSKITTLRPKDYSEARTIGERFRDGNPVIMDLVAMDNADAKRLVDFAAGLAFALRGSFDKVATKVFLLSPADVDVTAEERRRIAEAGFYSYQ
ncbi:cell division protein SepF [Mycolicibacterium thermoresistibile]|jgi:cell division inhibitor SepF|uniref:Cell division protein SepF n=2 Tax=Mycolicibacterium thermoresistibile TaxID=1797 RepID=G7CMH6_MYCT3|nr:cell division protein SepF [Mycolicibacterium thermoresistibile]EHI10796.1 cell division protein sepF [Mycolicibacterium thermoresistibile ATCC 19527]MCV7190639.1 cell division protein SepF [Mycolicibacterium thermoresistibile]GAT16949.1 cell division protein sepF [Mycolicibacterium thermoresistibile]SNW18074.1 cell division protein sepF [Mycolicibacterium thermoresistibile]